MIYSRPAFRSLGILALLAVSACTHVKGQVIEDRTRRPVLEAVFTVGRPDGVSATASYKVDNQGKFDFYISPTDENYLFVWDGKGDPQVDVRRVQPTEINDHMLLVMPWVRPGMER